MTTETRTAQVFERLKEAASEFSLVDYGQLAAGIGAAAIGSNQYLDPIYDFCRKREYPEINVLAVNKSTGVPARNIAPDGPEQKEPMNLQGIIYWCSEIVRVYSYDWSDIHYQAS